MLVKFELTQQSNCKYTGVVGSIDNLWGSSWTVAIISYNETCLVWIQKVYQRKKWH